MVFFVLIPGMEHKRCTIDDGVEPTSVLSRPWLSARGKSVHAVPFHSETSACRIEWFKRLTAYSGQVQEEGFINSSSHLYSYVILMKPLLQSQTLIVHFM